MVERVVIPDVLDVEVRALLGECPWWDGNGLSWVDILGNRLHRCRLDGSDLRSFDLGGSPGFALPDSAGDWVVGLPDGVWVGDPERADWRHVWIAPHDPTVHRMNDAKPDALGRLWMGSMTYAEVHPVSALYRMDERGTTVQMDRVITSNGLGWSPDNTTFYFTDSIAAIIWSFDFDLGQGTLSRPRVFAEDPAGYVPDGGAVDDEGCFWSAKWDGGRIVRYAPDGHVDTVLHVPVSRPTSCMFVGDDRSTLAVTSARPADPSRAAELDGAVLLIPTTTTGPLLCPVSHEGVEQGEHIQP